MLLVSLLLCTAAAACWMLLVMFIALSSRRQEIGLTYSWQELNSTLYKRETGQERKVKKETWRRQGSSEASLPISLVFTRVCRAALHSRGSSEGETHTQVERACALLTHRKRLEREREREREREESLLLDSLSRLLCLFFQFRFTGTSRLTSLA